MAEWDSKHTGLLSKGTRRSLECSRDCLDWRFDSRVLPQLLQIGARPITTTNNESSFCDRCGHQSLPFQIADSTGHGPQANPWLSGP